MTVETGKDGKADTDDDVDITLLDSGAVLMTGDLDNIAKDDFEKGKVNKFTLFHPSDVMLRPHDLKSVKVETTTGK